MVLCTMCYTVYGFSRLTLHGMFYTMVSGIQIASDKLLCLGRSANNDCHHTIYSENTAVSRQTPSASL